MLPDTVLLPRAPLQEIDSQKPISRFKQRPPGIVKPGSGSLRGGGEYARTAMYREYRPPPELEPVVACLWENEAAEERVQRVVPDGCVDLIWGAGLTVAGADTGPRLVDLPAGARLSGIRLRPGAAGAFLGLPASEVRDLQVPAGLVWRDEEIEEALAGAGP